MCVTAVVKCWHCGEWFAKRSARGEFEDCPYCNKGFDDLTPEAQKAVKATLAPFFEVPQVKQIA